MGKHRLFTCFIYIIASFIAFIVLFPILWMVLTSFKTTNEIYAFPIIYFPTHFTIKHYISALSQGNFLAYFLNSSIIALGSVIISLFFSVLPAYSLYKFKFPGKNTLLLTILMLEFLPQASFVVPMFRFIKTIHLINNYFGVMISYLPFIVPIQIILLMGFFEQIPESLEEAAEIDGSSHLNTFLKIILPISISSITAVGVYSFFFSWSELMFAMSFLTQQNKQTIPVFLSFLVGQFGINWGQLFAISTLSILPAIIMFAFLQRLFMAGLTAGSIKE
ncbi:MAG: carbohydrate ABC transporter permease [Nitrososphaeria archaeon]